MEVPGGSSFKPNMDPCLNAAKELKEETGLEVSDLNRFRRLGSRQLTATLSTHHAHLFSIELTEKEMEFLEGKKGLAQGVLGDTERTYVEIQTLRALWANNEVDYSMLGMIFDALT